MTNDVIVKNLTETIDSKTFMTSEKVKDRECDLCGDGIRNMGYYMPVDDYRRMYTIDAGCAIWLGLNYGIDIL